MEVKIRADAGHSSIAQFISVFNPIYEHALRHLRQFVDRAAARVSVPRADGQDPPEESGPQTTDFEK